LLDGKSELGRVIERERSSLRLTTEMQVTELSCDYGPERERWRVGLVKKLRVDNAKL
jgi:hypothetical protein